MYNYRTAEYATAVYKCRNKDRKKLMKTETHVNRIETNLDRNSD